MTLQLAELAAFGWQNSDTAELSADEIETCRPVRVVAVERSGLRIAGPGIDTGIPPFRSGEDEEGAATVGDWLLLDGEALRPRRLLPRKSLLKRRAPGTGRQIQLIAANVDVLFIVTSCNQDFNIARLERYLALAREAGALPVILLTKADLADDAGTYASAAADGLPGVFVAAIDARSAAVGGQLLPYWRAGQTAALVGSSGVGKSTLVNTLLGRDEIATAGIREDDDKGRHTTTSRALYRLANGAWLVDTPGMRELQLTDAEFGISAVFEDIVALAGDCRFGDCRHEGEPGCAVRAAIEAGDLDPARLARWQKLHREETHNSASLAERRAKDRKFGKMVKRAMAEKRQRE
ncbi:MAG TPA: ribosome small subunit-dependent GTPase A [Kaistiaceae bacterium]|nr:ribosome small subunit-dependent GTPase A [Kaistiaceae bacterium]